VSRPSAPRSARYSVWSSADLGAGARSSVTAWSQCGQRPLTRRSEPRSGFRRRGQRARTWRARAAKAAYGYRDLAKLAVAIENDLARTTVPSPTEEAGAAAEAGTGGSFRSGKRGGR